MASKRGEYATLIDDRRRVLAMWIKPEPRFFGQGIGEISDRIAALKSHRGVDRCIRDFVVVNGNSFTPKLEEVMVIVHANQLKDDQIAFNVLTKLIRELLEGAYEEISFPKDKLHDPREILDCNFLGWHPVKRR